MKSLLKYGYFVLLVCLITLGGCYPTRKLKSNEQWLLKSNTVSLQGETQIDSDELEAIIKQRPNRNIGFPIPVPSLWKSPFDWDFVLARINLRAYNVGQRGKGPFFQWLSNKVGEPPVIYDTLLTRRTLSQMNEYLCQKGYFDNRIEVLSKYSKRKKMVRIAYVIQPGQPKRISKINLNIPQEKLREIYDQQKDKALIGEGDIYNYSKLESERQRLVNLYQDRGYFDFTREYIRFDVDTNFTDHGLHLTLVVRNALLKTDSTQIQVPHVQYFPNKIFVYPEYDFFSNTVYTDTLVNDNVYIVYNKKLNINPRLIYNNLFFNKSYYSQSDANITYRSFNSLNLYRNIRIEFKKPVYSPKTDILDGFIYLSPLKRNSFSTEARLETRSANGSGANKSSYNLGVSGNLSFQRRNAFRNGEILKLSIQAGLEPFFLSDSSASKNFFNTTEIGPTLSVTFPRFLLPIKQERFAKSARAKTTIAANYSALRNDDITRKATRLSLSYEWNETAKKVHIVNPIELSFVNTKLSSLIDQRLNALGDPFLRNTYSSQYIQASSYSFIYSDQYTSKSKKAYYNRSKIEAAGNLLRAVASSTNNWRQEGTSYTVNDIPFAQYVKIENEFKTYQKTFFNNVVAFRLYGGLAKPMANLGSLPFEKSFFVGGTNGIRAWGARSLGPGSYFDTTSFRGFLNRLGEIQLESNIEYRFKITKLLEWAFFADAGNIWVFRERGNRQGTEFTSKFYRQLALGAGFGARMDFDFVVLRVDLAFPIHDPSKPEGEKWITQRKDQYNEIVRRYNERLNLSGNGAISSYRIKPNLNIGIGYPF
ncbi:MAG TPA: POTRA domain-containing protein [Luteibaculaceae bacterium]|nr:POTRA domain-containing protein [Luteibaculaceae bacterium]